MDKVSQCLKVPKVIYNQKDLKSAQEQVSAQKKCPSHAWGLPFEGSPMFTLTSMVMLSIIIEVMHMYISMAIKLF